MLKFQILVCLWLILVQKSDKKLLWTDRLTNKGKTVYPNLIWSINIFSCQCSLSNNLHGVSYLTSTATLTGRPPRVLLISSIWVWKYFSIAIYNDIGTYELNCSELKKNRWNFYKEHFPLFPWPKLHVEIWLKVYISHGFKYSSLVF